MTGAMEYGKALFLITEEDGTTEKVMSDVKIARAAFVSNPDYAKLLDTPALPKEERIGLVDKAFSGLDGSLINLIKIITEKRLSHEFTKIADAYLALYDESRGILRVEAVTAIPITAEQNALLVKKVSALTGKTAIIKNTVDPSILGGMKLRYSGTQLDGSIKTRLDKFEATLRETVI